MKRRDREYWLFTLPALVSILLFVAIPLGYVFYLSLRDFSLMMLTDRFIGGKNYIRILGDRAFLLSLFRTWVYVVVVVMVDFIYGFSVALVLYRLPIVWAKVFRGILMLPILLIPTAAAMLWRYVMFAPPNSVFNRLIGLPLSESILANASTALWGVILAAIWGWSPFVLLLLLAGLEGLPKEPLEAAQIDGANYIQQVLYIIFPMMKPVIFVTLSYKAMDSFLSFPYPWVMTAGGPAGSSHLLSTYIYEQAFQYLDYGYGSAMAIVMMVLGLLTSLFTILYARKQGYV